MFFIKLGIKFGRDGQLRLLRERDTAPAFVDIGLKTSEQEHSLSVSIFMIQTFHTIYHLMLNSRRDLLGYLDFRYEILDF